MVVDVPLHIVAILDDKPVGAVGMAFTVAVTAVRDADTQPVVLFRACA
jgi:hypothetical protein